MKKLASLILLTALLAVTLLSSCAKDDGIIPVRIGYFPNITHSQALVAKAQGTYETALGEDCKVSWLSFNAGPSEIEAMFAGEVDIGYIGPIPAINGYYKSKGDIQIIAGATNGGAVLVTRSDLVLTDIKQLDGLKVAIPQLGNTQHLSLLHILSENGLKSADKGGTVTVIPSENADTQTLMDKGDIDAALVPEPWGARLVNDIGANVMLDYRGVWMDGDYSTAVVVVKTDFLKKHPDIVEEFLRAHASTTDFINENKETAKSIVNEQILSLTQKSLDQKVLDEAFERMIITTDPAAKSVMAFIDIYKNEGFIESSDGKEGLIDTSILEKINTAE